MTNATRYFVPVCLYPHTAYRTSSGVSTLFKKYRLHSHEHLIVIADTLLALDHLVTGRYWSAKQVFPKAHRDSEQVHNLFLRISHKVGAHNYGKIVYWDAIAGTEQFKEFAKLMRAAFLAEEPLSAALEDFVGRRVERFWQGSSREQEYEREYLLGEVCMSVYCTEILGYQTEIWERPPAPGTPDPLKLLYLDHLDLVSRVTGHPAARVLDFLFGGEACDVTP